MLFENLKNKQTNKQKKQKKTHRKKFDFISANLNAHQI